MIKGLKNPQENKFSHKPRDTTFFNSSVHMCSERWDFYFVEDKSKASNLTSRYKLFNCDVK